MPLVNVGAQRLEQQGWLDIRLRNRKGLAQLLHKLAHKTTQAASLLHALIDAVAAVATAFRYLPCGLIIIINDNNNNITA